MLNFLRDKLGPLLVNRTRWTQLALHEPIPTPIFTLSIIKKQNEKSRGSFPFSPHCLLPTILISSLSLSTLSYPHMVLTPVILPLYLVMDVQNLGEQFTVRFVKRLFQLVENLNESSPTVLVYIFIHHIQHGAAFFNYGVYGWIEVVQS